jgi:urease gamma subunit
MDSNRKQSVIAIVAAILAARKLATVPRNSPAAVATISDAVADAKRIVERVERSFEAR